MIVQVCSTPKRKLNYCDRFDRVPSMMKTIQDNNVIDRIGVVYAEIGTKQ